MAEVADRPHTPLRLAGAASDLIDLDDLVTQRVVIFVGPADDPEAMAREIAAYEELLAHFCDAGAWVIGVAASLVPLPAPSGHLRLAVDPDGTALDDLARRAGIAADPGVGATFVLERGGQVRAAWTGGGRARDALASTRD